MLPDVVNTGHIQNIRNVMIPEIAHLETNWMQMLHMKAIDPIP